MIPIPSCDYRYAATCDGTIYSLVNKNNAPKRMAKTSCSDGYLRVKIYLKNGTRKFKAIHRLVAEVFCENLNNYPEVNHIDGKKHNNNSGNLEWVTRSQNMRHAVSIGLHKPGIAKHDLANAESVQKLRKEGKTFAFIADQFGCSLSTAHKYATTRSNFASDIDGAFW
jgi:hypothetical protein